MAKKIIIILVIILIVLILITSFISNFLKNKKPATEIKNIIPTAVVNYGSGSSVNRDTKTGKADTQIAQDKKLTDKIISQIKILPQTDIEILNSLNKTIPFTSADFDVEYSPYLNQYFVSKKTPNADKQITFWAAENKLSELIKNPNLFIFTDQPVMDYRKQLEETVLKNNQPSDRLISPISFAPTPKITSSLNLSVTPATTDPVFSAFAKILKSFYLSGTKIASPEAYNPSSTSPQSTNQPSSQITTPLGQYSPAPTSLTEIFNEAGQKVGVPPKILEAVMRIECATPFSYSAQQIAQYSQPGGKVPVCVINKCSAAGPMQFTIGVDDQGSTTCSRCELDYCPTTWLNYANAVNTYGGYTHQSNPWNLRDSVYATASFFKRVTGATNSADWTRDQVFSAAESYFGDDSCTEKADKYRLLPGKRTYCEFVWDYYTTR